MSVQLANSGNVANATAAATFSAVANLRWYVTGFRVDVTGATAASVVSATITGLAGGTMTFPVVFPLGATADGTRIGYTFPSPIPASAVNTAVSLSVPAGGTGNTNAAATLFGYSAS